LLPGDLLAERRNLRPDIGTVAFDRQNLLYQLAFGKIELDRINRAEPFVSLDLSAFHDVEREYPSRSFARNRHFDSLESTRRIERRLSVPARGEAEDEVQHGFDFHCIHIFIDL
jgi:hypothetical protein